MSKRVRRRQGLAPGLPVWRHRGQELVLSSRNDRNNKDNNATSGIHGYIKGASSSSSALERNGRSGIPHGSTSQLYVPSTLSGHRRVCGKRPRHARRDTSSHWQSAAEVSLEVGNPSNERIVRLGTGVGDQEENEPSFHAMLYVPSWNVKSEPGLEPISAPVAPVAAAQSSYIISPYTGRRLRAVIWQDTDAIPHYRQVLHDAILTAIRRRVRIRQQLQQQQAGEGEVAATGPSAWTSRYNQVQGEQGDEEEEEEEDLRVVFSLTQHSPVAYVPLQPRHVGQVNSLLEREFWPGIDISDALQYPEHGIVAVCQHLVVGCALMTPSGYVTFVAVHPHWRRFGVATFMLYFLIKGYPHRDITLHVSANNNAMILYQKFGFKPEEYVRDFYNKFLPANSPDCKHAYLLRLRQQ